MGKVIHKVARHVKEDDFIEIFDQPYRTLGEKDQGNVKVVRRAKELAVQYKDMNFKDMDVNNLSFDQTLDILTLLDDLVRVILPAVTDDVVEELQPLEKVGILQVYFDSENGKELLASASKGDMPSLSSNQPAVSRPGPTTSAASPQPSNRAANRARATRSGNGKPGNQRLVPSTKLAPIRTEFGTIQPSWPAPAPSDQVVG